MKKSKYVIWDYTRIDIKKGAGKQINPRPRQ